MTSNNDKFILLSPMLLKSKKNGGTVGIKISHRILSVY